MSSLHHQTGEVDDVPNFIGFGNSDLLIFLQIVDLLPNPILVKSSTL